ncbi:hypothetical protein [Deinococcus aquaedulcis]|uniref:hypothetical protein n=1 Tax=Deinococcus aquaedulcis TaxID=2840455 RepID=UPI001C83A0A9|nr:hypothetical protein [Deinococcus aquaedulcis]
MPRYRPRLRRPHPGSLSVHVWVDDLPAGYRLPPGTEVRVSGGGLGLWPERHAAVSLDFVSGIPRFGLLGGSFTPTSEGDFVVVLPAPVPLDEVPYGDAPDRRAGLPGEFHAAVLRGLAEPAASEPFALPAGTLTLEVAGHDVVGTSSLVMLRVAQALRRLLAQPSLTEALLADPALYELRPAAEAPSPPSNR